MSDKSNLEATRALQKIILLCQRDQFYLIPKLIEQGADVDAKFGNQLLSECRQEKNVPRVARVLNMLNGEDVLLLVAVHLGSPELVRIILEAGIEARSKVDVFLDWAYLYSSTDIMKILLEWGADPDHPMLMGCVLRSEDKKFAIEAAVILLQAGFSKNINEILSDYQEIEAKEEILKSYTEAQLNYAAILLKDDHPDELKLKKVEQALFDIAKLKYPD